MTFKQSSDGTGNLGERKLIPGRGEFSVVHLGVHKKTGEKFAIKVIEKNEMDTSRLETEVNILKKVQHANIIHLKEFFDTPKKLYLVMELCVPPVSTFAFLSPSHAESVTGGELFNKIIELGSYTEAVAAAVVRNILSAVNYLHQNGIVHRDLKVRLLPSSLGSHSASQQISCSRARKISLT